MSDETSPTGLDIPEVDDCSEKDREPCQKECCLSREELQCAQRSTESRVFAQVDRWSNEKRQLAVPSAVFADLVNDRRLALNRDSDAVLNSETTSCDDGERGKRSPVAYSVVGRMVLC